MKIEDGVERMSIPGDAIMVGRCRRCKAGLYIEKGQKKLYNKNMHSNPRGLLFECTRCGNKQTEADGWNTKELV